MLHNRAASSTNRMMTAEGIRDFIPLVLLALHIALACHGATTIEATRDPLRFFFHAMQHDTKKKRKEDERVKRKYRIMPYCLS